MNDKVLKIGNFAIDISAFLGSLIPYSLVSSLLYNVIFTHVIETWWLRMIVSLASAMFVELFAIGVMTLEYRVSQFNQTLYVDEVAINYHAGRAKIVYMAIIIIVALIGHILPAIFPKDIASVWSMTSLLPMIILAYFSYEMFSVNITVKERVALREQAKKDRMAELSAQTFRERSDKAEERKLLELQYEQEKLRLETQVRLAEQNRLTAEAEAKAAAARVREAKIERQEIAPVQVHTNGHAQPVGAKIDWRNVTPANARELLTTHPAPEVTEGNLNNLAIIKAECGSSFTVKEAMKAINKSESGTRQLVNLLFAAGYIEQVGNEYIVKR